jgi:uncharacterized membrane protein YgdD (TMEM256/DUF423 family)
MIAFARIAAALCFLAVALGAFGAHWLKPIIDRNGMLDVWNKAVFYHFTHAIVLLFLAFFGATNRGACWLFCAGVLLFSGSLYTMALTNIRWLGAITPLGGLCFLAGWAWLFFAPRPSG